MSNKNLITIEVKVLVNNPDGGEAEEVRKRIRNAIWEKARQENKGSCSPTGWFHSETLGTGYVNIYSCKVSEPRIKK